MALWKDSMPPAGAQAAPASSATRDPDKASTAAPTADAGKRRPEAKETIIANDLAIEGKIEGAGHVRIAGRFKGDVQVDGNLTIEAGAHVTGQVYAKTVIIGGELHGNINGASRVELLDSGVLEGDVKAGTLTVAAGSRMRGQAEFGWGDPGVKSVPGK
jgi:cytoskeletal protein CcmA (bactofilin family)